MKRMLKKSLAFILALTLVFGAAPLAGLVGLELPSLKDVFADKAEAATYGVLTYEINDGKVTITDCDESASGELVIPEEIEGYPVTSIDDYVFSDCTGLTSVTIPGSVTGIGNYAFSSLFRLTSVTIPDRVTSIGYGAFRNCNGLTSVTIPASVTNICSSAFENCDSLVNISVDEGNKYYSSDDFGVLFNKDKTELIQYPIGNERTEYVIPSSITKIGNYAFEYCDFLTSVTIPASVTRIGDSAFSVCFRLTSVTIPNSVTSIGCGAFRNCNGLTSVTIPASVTYIGSEAFSECYNLESFFVDESNQYYSSDESGVLLNKDKTELIQYPIGNERTEYIIPNTIIIIGDYAFYNCYRLTSVTIPDSVTSIEWYAFSDCSKLVNIKIGNGIKKIDNTVFSNTGYYNNKENWVDNVLYIDNCLIKAKTDISDEYSIKEGTRFIADRAFYNCSSLTSISIPGSVEYIGSAAFSGCSNLSSATLKNGIIDIEDYAFRTCISLTSILIPDSVEKIGTNAFYGCLNLKTVSMGSGVKSIEQNAFAETGYYIDEDNWVDKVLYIDNCLIKAKNDITGDYAVKEGSTVIADRAFYGCNNLADVTIPDSVTNIGDFAFSGCSKLAIDTLPSALTKIGDYAFYYCDSIASITVSASVTSIGDFAFRHCNSLVNISVDESNQYYSSDESGVLFNKDKTELIQYPRGNERTEYIIPNSVTSIDDYAFYDCDCLTSVTIPGSVTSIGNYAFCDCYSLTNVSIPDSVTSIGDFAFTYCNSLVNISVDEGNQYYSSDNYGALFNNDKTELIQYPVRNERTEYIIPNSVTSIDDYAFYDCDYLTRVTIPNGVTRIGDYAFKFCINLTIDSLPSGLTSIGSSAFEYCNSLTTVTIPASVTSIGDRAFYSCENLTVVSLPQGLISIGYDAFNMCSNLTTVTIPASVTYIGSAAFSGCINLESIFVDEDNPKYSSDNFGVLLNKDKTELIQYPIGNERTSYTVLETVQTIGDYSFYYCKNLISITIPKSVSSIYYYAFSCDNLNTVYYSGSPSMWNKIYVDSGNDKLKNATIIYAEEDSETGEVQKETVSDEATDVSVEYISNFHEGEVGLEVERTFDGKAFDVISTQLDINSNEIYDIKMTVDGVATQPNGKIKVKIPIPAGYDPAKTFVYHVNTNTGTVENMNAVVDGNYLVFETDHFSYYAVVEVKNSAPDEPVEQSYKITWNIDGKITEQKYEAGDVITVPQNPVKSGYRFVGWSPAVPTTMPSYDLTFTAVFEKLSSPTEDRLTVSIRTPSTTSVDYGDSIILHLDIDRPLPDGAYIEWSESNGNFDMSVSADGITCKISPKSNGKTVFTATVYDKDGNLIGSDTQEMTAKAGLWQKIVAFFKKIFGLTKTFPEAFKGIL